MDILVWVIVGLIAGALIGSLITWWWSVGRGGGDTIGQLKRENEEFREEVTEHFVETARLINQLTDSYKEVFDHLSRGANKLVDEKSLAEKMPRVSGQEVRLRHLGAPDAAAAASDEPSSSETGDAGDAKEENQKASDGDESEPSSDQRAPHERDDIEAGPRAGEPDQDPSTREDRDIDPLKRSAKDAPDKEQGAPEGERQDRPDEDEVTADSEASDDSETSDDSENREERRDS